MMRTQGLRRAPGPAVFAALVAAWSAALLAPQPALACGGFFCNAATQSPIYQAGERIVFIKHGELVTMHIEVRYEGEPTEFAWLLPLPELPQDAQGQPLPLERAVTVSSTKLFDALDSATRPQFNLNSQFDSNDECSDFQFGGCADQAGSVRGGDFGAPPQAAPRPGVDVVEAARVGPYDAQLLEAKSSDALFDWLNANGYYQDPASKQLLGHYIGLGYVFLGIRLQSGKSTGDLRPIALTFGEQAPCVPLRLTGIAATPDMPITVFVAGDGRAVPKNFIHAVVNPMALDWPNVANYFDVIKDAVDTASGRAWVTESSGVVPLDQGTVVSPAVLLDIRQAETLHTLASALQSLVEEAPMVVDVLDDLVCWHPADHPEGDCEPVGAPSEAPKDRLASYVAVAKSAATGDGAVEVDLAAVHARLEATVLTPLGSIVPMLDGLTVTRFFTMLDPDEMVRDPLFAFNPELPDVPRLNTLRVREFQDDACNQFHTRTYPNGHSQTVACADGGCTFFDIPPVPGAPALEFPEVLDESGAPIRFHLEQVAEIDALLDKAQPGAPSLPAQLEIRPPGAAPSLDNARPEVGGCGASPRALEWLLVLSLGLLVGRAATVGRRRRS